MASRPIIIVLQCKVRCYLRYPSAVLSHRQEEILIMNYERLVMVGNLQVLMDELNVNAQAVCNILRCQLSLGQSLYGFT